MLRASSRTEKARALRRGPFAFRGARRRVAVGARAGGPLGAARHADPDERLHARSLPGAGPRFVARDGDGRRVLGARRGRRGDPVQRRRRVAALPVLDDDAPTTSSPAASRSRPRSRTPTSTTTGTRASATTTSSARRSAGCSSTSTGGSAAIISLQNYSLGTPRQLGLDASDVKSLTVRIFKVDAVVVVRVLRRPAARRRRRARRDLQRGRHVVGETAPPRHVRRRRAGRRALASATICRSALGAHGPLAGHRQSIEAAPNVTRNADDRRSRQVGQLLPSDGRRPAVGGRVGRRRPDRPASAQHPVDRRGRARGPRSRRAPEEPGDATTPPVSSRDSAARRILRAAIGCPAREAARSRSAMLVTGPTTGAVGVESMLTQVVDRSGERTSVTMRGGRRGGGRSRTASSSARGSYMEPTRFRESSPRAPRDDGLRGARSSSGRSSASSRRTTRSASAARSTCRASTSAGASASAAGTELGRARSPDRIDHAPSRTREVRDPATARAPRVRSSPIAAPRDASARNFPRSAAIRDGTAVAPRVVRRAGSHRSWRRPRVGGSQ